MTKQRELAEQIVMLNDRVSSAVREAAKPVGYRQSDPQFAKFEKERNEQLQKATKSYRRVGELLKKLTAENLEIVD